MAGLLSRALNGLGKGLQAKAEIDWRSLEAQAAAERAAALQKIDQQYRTGERVAGDAAADKRLDKQLEASAAESKAQLEARKIESDARKNDSAADRAAAMARLNAEIAARPKPETFTNEKGPDGRVTGNWSSTGEYKPVRGESFDPREVEYKAAVSAIYSNPLYVMDSTKLNAALDAATQRFAKGSSAQDPAAAPADAGMPAPKSKEEFDSLPSGTRYRAPNGSVRIKP